MHRKMKPLFEVDIFLHQHLFVSFAILLRIDIWFSCFKIVIGNIPRVTTITSLYLLEDTQILDSLLVDKDQKL